MTETMYTCTGNVKGANLALSVSALSRTLSVGEGGECIKHCIGGSGGMLLKKKIYTSPLYCFCCKLRGKSTCIELLFPNL